MPHFPVEQEEIKDSAESPENIFSTVAGLLFDKFSSRRAALRSELYARGRQEAR